MEIDYKKQRFNFCKTNYRLEKNKEICKKKWNQISNAYLQRTKLSNSALKTTYYYY